MASVKDLGIENADLGQQIRQLISKHDEAVALGVRL